MSHLDIVLILVVQDVLLELQALSKVNGPSSVVVVHSGVVLVKDSVFNGSLGLWVALYESLYACVLSRLLILGLVPFCRRIRFSSSKISAASLSLKTWVRDRSGPKLLTRGVSSTGVSTRVVGLIALEGALVVDLDEDRRDALCFDLAAYIVAKVFKPLVHVTIVIVDIIINVIKLLLKLLLLLIMLLLI